jgi:hypothetical protein
MSNEYNGIKSLCSYLKAQNNLLLSFWLRFGEKTDFAMFAAGRFSFDWQNCIFQVFLGSCCLVSHKPRRCRPRFCFQLQRHLSLSSLRVLLQKHLFFSKSRFGAESNVALGIGIWNVWLLLRRLASEPCL